MSEFAQNSVLFFVGQRSISMNTSLQSSVMPQSTTAITYAFYVVVATRILSMQEQSLRNSQMCLMKKDLKHMLANTLMIMRWKY